LSNYFAEVRTDGELDRVSSGITAGMAVTVTPIAGFGNCAEAVLAASFSTNHIAKLRALAGER